MIILLGYLSQDLDLSYRVVIFQPIIVLITERVCQAKLDRIFAQHSEIVIRKKLALKKKAILET
jgi:hypothetical protein